jgi:choline dehydrogenase-like flavoprotein
MDDHGTDGPIQVSKGTYASPRIQDQCISAMNELGWPEIDDFYSAETCNGVQRPVRYISRDGKRQDTASRYLRPRLEDNKHPNLHVVVGTKVVKVLIEGQRATGIVLKGIAAEAKERTIRANRLVVVSAGTFGTPAILERSGVGSAEVLERAGVTQVVDLAGVGREYEDHSMVMYSFKSALEPEETIDGILRGKMNPAELIQSNHAILGWNTVEASLKIRPSEEDIATFSPEFKEHWDIEYRNKKGKPLVLMALICT